MGLFLNIPVPRVEFLHILAAKRDSIRLCMRVTRNLEKAEKVVYSWTSSRARREVVNFQQESSRMSGTAQNTVQGALNVTVTLDAGSDGMTEY